MTSDSFAASLQIRWNRLVSMMDEADIALLHSAFSTVVSDSRDYAVVLLDRNARSIAQAQVCVPAFTCSLPSAARKMLEEFRPETLKPGDILFTNDPWICHGHLPDFYVIKPIFDRGAIVAYFAAAAHISDIGGRLDELVARDVYEEGLRLPPCKLYEAGEPNAAIIRIIQANTRHPRLVLGDLGAVIGASAVVESRCKEFIVEYGDGAIDEIADEILDRSEAAMRAAITALPDGDYEYAITCDGYLIPTEIRLRLTVRDDSLFVDYTGSSPQRSDASVNCVLNVTHAHSIFALKCSLTPDLPNNEGLFRPIKTWAPSGSIVNATFPAPVRGRSMTSYHLHNAIFGALSRVIPDRVRAGSGSFWWVSCSGRDANGQPYAVHVLPNGGTGAVQGCDGHSTMAFPGNGTITPVEIIENKAPIMVLERSLWVDSGGAGEFRGGLGQVIRICASTESVRMTLRPDKVRFPPPGLAGGMPGAKGEFLVNDATIPIEPFELKCGQILTLKIPGGGGIGDPHRRNRALVQQDVDSGLVSAGAARALYDLAATT